MKKLYSVGNGESDSEDRITVIALTHYYLQHGDLMAGPDLEIAINVRATHE